jgi:hypothetical protein
VASNSWLDEIFIQLPTVPFSDLHSIPTALIMAGTKAMIEFDDSHPAVQSHGRHALSLNAEARPNLRGLSDLLLALSVGCAILGLAGQPASHASEPAMDPAARLNADPHLVGWWKFDETTGKTAMDSAKSGHAATLSDGLSFESRSIEGRLGRAIRLAGSNDLIGVTGYKGVTGSGPRTVALWVKTKESSGDLVTWGTSDAGKMFILGHIRGRIGVTPKGGYFYMNADINDDVWHHVAVVIREGSPPNLHDHAQLFKDGKTIEPDGIGLLDMFPFETGDQLDVCIGRHFKGAIDDLRIYDRALSEEEIGILATPAK